MYPAYVSVPLPYQFIYGWKGLEEGQILQPFIHRWQMYVCRLATHVLGVLHSAYGTVQFGATVAARYADGVIVATLHIACSTFCQLYVLAEEPHLAPEVVLQA